AASTAAAPCPRVPWLDAWPIAAQSPLRADAEGGASAAAHLLRHFLLRVVADRSNAHQPHGLVDPTGAAEGEDTAVTLTDGPPRPPSGVRVHSRFVDLPSLRRARRGSSPTRNGSRSQSALALICT